MAQLLVPAIKGFAVSVLLGGILRSIFKPDDLDPIDAPFRATKATRGAQVPLLIGRDQLAPVVISEKNRRVVLEQNSTAGGKGIGGGGSGLDNEVVYASFMMALCVGPAQRMREIRYNGERIWPRGSEFPRGIVQHSSPSGSEFDTQGDPSVGPFRIYWGEIDQPFEEDAVRPSQFPIRTRLPYVCWLYWPSFRLGGQGTLGQLLVDIESRPFLEANTNGTNYESVGGLSGGELGGGSNPWLRNARVVDEANGADALLYDAVAGTIKVAGDVASEFANGEFVALRYPGQADQFGLSLGATYNAGETIQQNPNSFTTRLISEDIGADWTAVDMTATQLFVYPPTVAPFSGSGIATWQLSETAISFGEGTITDVPLTSGYVPPGADPGAGADAGDGYQVFTCYVRASSFGDVRTRIYLGSDFGDNTKHGYAEFDSLGGSNNVTLGTVTNTRGTTASVSRILSSDWFLCTVYQETGGSRNDILPTETLQMRIGVSPIGVSGAASSTVCLASGVNPLNSIPALRFSSFITVTGVTTVDTDLNLIGLTDFFGTLYPYVLDANADAGANAAHSIYQLMFEEDPHGLGLDQSYYDITSLQDVGVELQTEGLRTHIIVEDNQTVKEKLSHLLLEMGIDVTWDITRGVYVFSLRRDATVDTIVPQRLLHGPLPSRVRRLESGVARSYVFTFPVAEEDYQTRSVEADDAGNVAVAERSGVETEPLRTPRDLEVGQVIASRRAVEEQANVNLTSVDLKWDAVTLRSNDVIDIDEIIGDPQPHRIASVNVQPKSRKMRANCYPEAFATAADPLRFGLGFPPEAPTPLADDAASIALNTNDGILTLRIPNDPRAVYGLVLGSEDGVSYWTTGATKGAGGGRYVGEESTNMFVLAPTTTFTDSIPPADSAAAASNVMLAATTKGEVFPFRSIVDLGGGMYRIEGVLRTAPIALDNDDYVFLWRDGQMPTIDTSLPSDPGRKFKVVPATPGEIGNPAMAPELTEIDITSEFGLIPTGGTTGQVLSKLSNADYDTAWSTVVGGGGALETGVGYYDVPNDYFYITYGVDGNWEAIRYRDVEESTGAGQPGPVPTDIVTLAGLTYS